MIIAKEIEEEKKIRKWTILKSNQMETHSKRIL